MLKIKTEILIIKIFAIGDVVMALPMVKAARDKYPQAKITWICGRAVAGLVRKVAQVDEIISIDEKTLIKGGVFKKLFVLVRLWKEIFMRRFDLVVIGHADPRYKLLALPVRFKALRHFNRTAEHIFPIPGRHHSNEYIRLITNEAGPISENASLPHVNVRLPQHLQTVAGPNGKPVVALAPGGAKNILSDDYLRRWPLKSYVQLAEKLTASGIRVILTGSPSDTWVKNAFNELAVENFIGKTSLLELVALFQNCDVVVTHDSGPLHLAGLAHTKLIALFGPTNPHEKVPMQPGVQIFWGGEKLACRPCYNGKNYAKCSENVCMAGIAVEQVYRAAMTFIKQNGSNVLEKQAIVDLASEQN